MEEEKSERPLILLAYSAGFDPVVWRWNVPTGSSISQA
jgi:hypothetical protein